MTNRDEHISQITVQIQNLQHTYEFSIQIGINMKVYTPHRKAIMGTINNPLTNTLNHHHTIILQFKTYTDNNIQTTSLHSPQPTIPADITDNILERQERMSHTLTNIH